MNVKFNLGLSESDRPRLVLDVCLHVFLQFVLRGSARSPQEIEFIYIRTVGLRMDAWQSVWPELGKRSKRFLPLANACHQLGNHLAIAWQSRGNTVAIGPFLWQSPFLATFSTLNGARF